jgi:transposase-like protein
MLPGKEKTMSKINFQIGLLSPKKARAILALVQHGNKERAAQEAGVHPATLWRWLQQPGFQEALHQARLEAFAQCNERLRQASPAAVSTVLRVMTDPQASPSSKLRASLAVLEFNQRSLDLESLQERLTRLETNIDPAG